MTCPGNVLGCTRLFDIHCVCQLFLISINFYSTFRYRAKIMRNAHMSSFKCDDTKLSEIRTILTNKFAENYVSVRISGIIISWPSVYSSPVSPHFQICYRGLFTSRRTLYLLWQLMNRQKGHRFREITKELLWKTKEKKKCPTHEYKLVATQCLLLFTHPAPRRQSEKCTQPYWCVS